MKEHFTRVKEVEIDTKQPETDVSQKYGLDGNKGNRYFTHDKTGVEAIVFRPIERTKEQNPKVALDVSLYDWFSSGNSLENRYKKTVILLKVGSGFDSHIEATMHQCSKVLSGESLPDDLKLDIQKLDDYTFRKVCFRDLGYDLDKNMSREEKEKVYLEKMMYTEKTEGELLSLNSNILAVVGKRKDSVVEVITVLDKSNSKFSLNLKEGKIKVNEQAAGWRLLDLDDDGSRGAIDPDDYHILQTVIADVKEDFFNF